MTDLCWTHQKARLIDRFGERNFSREFSLLVAIECGTMPDTAFVDCVNAIIGSRTPSQPPLVADFRHARIAYEKRIFERDVRGAAQTIEKTNPHGLQEFLAKEFPGCKTLNEAIEVRKHQIQIAKSDNPAYCPMRDAKWMGEHVWHQKGPWYPKEWPNGF